MQQLQGVSFHITAINLVEYIYTFIHSFMMENNHILFTTPTLSLIKKVIIFSVFLIKYVQLFHQIDRKTQYITTYIHTNEYNKKKKHQPNA